MGHFCPLGSGYGSTDLVESGSRIRNTGSEQLICFADTGQKLLLEDEMEELVEVQNKYERERRTRMMLEEKVR